MFIRYNETSDIWEYDSAGGTGAGPWLALPLNASILTAGTINLSRLANITDTEIAAAAAIAWSKLSKSGSVITDIADCLNTPWTPGFTINGSGTGITFSEQSGKYATFGSLVVALGRITLSNKGSGTGVARISNLPFTSSANYGAVFVGYYANFSAGVLGVNAYVEGSAATAVLTGDGITGGSATILTQANVTNTTDIIFVAIYFK